MKLNEAFELRDKIRKDNRKFETKEKMKELEYRSLKQCILEKVDVIEKGRAREQGYLRDLDEYAEKLKKRLGIDYFADKVEPPGEKPIPQVVQPEEKPPQPMW